MSQSKTEVIRYGDKEFPLGTMTVDQAKEIMARHFPELANPKIEKKAEGDKTVHVFSKQAGTKGGDGATVAATLIAVAEFVPFSPDMRKTAQAIQSGEALDYVALSWLDEDEIRLIGNCVGVETTAAEGIAKRLLALPSAWAPVAGGLL
jgi:hypothetical protein